MPGGMPNLKTMISPFLPKPKWYVHVSDGTNDPYIAGRGYWTEAAAKRAVDRLIRTATPAERHKRVYFVVRRNY